MGKLSRDQSPSVNMIGVRKCSLWGIILANILTLGTLYVLCQLSIKAKAFLLFNKIPLEKATHVILRDQYGQIQILKIDILSIERKREAKIYGSLILQRYIDHANSAVRILDTPYARFIYDFKVNQFIVPNYASNVVSNMNDVEKFLIFGDNFIWPGIYSFFDIFQKALFDISVLWQFAAVAVWIFIGYVKYSVIVGTIYLIIFMQNLWLSHKENSRNKIQLKSDLKAMVTKKIGGVYKKTPAAYIYPGDTILIENSDEFCCDARILKGDVITDESFLTGESVPVCKGPGDIIYAGTRVIKSSSSTEVHASTAVSKLIRLKNLLVRKKTGETSKIHVKTEDHTFSSAEATVIGTARRTKKGQLIKNLLLNNKPKDAFKAESYYVSICTMIATVLIFLSFVLYLQNYVSAKSAFVYPIDIFFTIFSPTLITCVELLFIEAKESLGKMGISCKDKSRIMISGDIEICCFDKTGTLTEIGLDVKLVDKILSKNLIKSDQNSYQEKLLKFAIGTCHSIIELNGEISGDILDMKMFLFSKAELYTKGKRKFVKFFSQKGTNDAYDNELMIKDYADINVPGEPASDEITSEDLDNCRLFIGKEETNQTTLDIEGEVETGEIIETFEFNSFLKKMSVITSIEGKQFLFCKGAPEMLKNDLIEVPAEYTQKVQEYAIGGYRIISVAYREIFPDELLKTGDKVSLRRHLEKNLNFLGLIVFANKLKEETPSVISQLTKAHIKSKICTGDSVLTAISVAKECGIVPRDIPIILPVFKEENEVRTVEGKSFFDSSSEDELALLDWLCVADDDYVFDKVRLCLYSEFDDNTEVDFAIAVEAREYSELMERQVYRKLLLEKGVVFARFNPDLKKHLVEQFSAHGKKVLFCGDGANDAGALSAADVGLLLTDGTKNLVGSFSSASLSAVISIITEGRGSLAAGMSQFKYIFYSQVLAGIQLLVLLINFNIPSDGMSLIVDLLSCYGLGYALLLFKGTKKLLPKRPVVAISSQMKMLTLELIMICFTYWIFTSLVMPTETVLQPLSSLDPRLWPNNLIHESSNASTIVFFVTFWLLIYKAIYFANYGGFKQTRISNFKFLVGVSLCLVVYALAYAVNFLETPVIYDFFEFTKLTSKSFWYLIPLLIVCTGITTFFNFMKSNIEIQEY